MIEKKRSRVLAIGIDAAEPSVVRQLIDRNEMPALKSLLDGGKWLRVTSPAHVGSGSVWPTFMTGEEPATHGVYGEWCWQPQAMSLVRYDGNNLLPFWKALSQKGMSIGILDVPFATPVGLTEGFEILEWGAHDTLGGRLQAGPAEVAKFLTEQIDPHPWSSDRHDNASPNDLKELERLSASCLQGVRIRGDLAKALLTKVHPNLALVVFPEIHHSAHHLWHTDESDTHFHSGPAPNDGHKPKPSSRPIYLELDKQIAALVKISGSDAATMVFSLHGMRSSAGIAAFLQPLLCESGFARLADWKAQSWTARALSLLAEVKRHTPEGVKKLYYKKLPRSATHQLARPTMMPAYDWSHTRAFSLPTDQHGWIRINLKGREALGLVSDEEYDDTCRQVEDLLRGLTMEDGRRLVRDVIRTTANVEEARSFRLPDMIVHWEDASFRSPTPIKGSAVEVKMIGKKFTGQHAPDGFCILKGGNDLYENDTLAAKDMHLLITRLLGRETFGDNSLECADPSALWSDATCHILARENGRGWYAAPGRRGTKR